MENQLSKKLMCVCLYDGIEIWMEEERVVRLLSALDRNATKIFELNGQYFNPNQIIGIFDAETMDARTRRKNGQWKCIEKGTWHPKGQKGIDEHEGCKPRKDNLPYLAERYPDL